MPRQTARRRLALLAIAGLAVASCRSTPPDPLERFWGEEHGEDGGLSSDQLRARLQEFTYQFSGAIQTTCMRICAEDDDILLRRRTIVWRSNIVPAVRRAANHDHPVEAFLDTWTLVMQQKLFLAGPRGEELFGDHVAFAIETSIELEKDIEKIGAAFMTTEDLARAREDVFEFATEHPLGGGWARQGNLPSTAGDKELEWLIGNPLSAVNPFGGLNTGAKAVMEFNKVADDFKNMMGHMPEELSWKLELLMTDLEERGRLRELNESVASVSRAALSLAETADRLPEETRSVITHTFDELEGQYEPLQATISESRAAIAELNQTVGSANELVLSLDRTLESVIRVGEAWEAVGLAFSSDEEEAAPSSPGDPDEPSFAEEFDITARSVTEAAVEIRGILADVRELAASDDPETVVAAATAASRSTIDHAAWRGVQLILVALGAAIVFLLVKARLLRRAE